MIPWLGASLNFPPLEAALSSPNPNGLLAAGGDLSSGRLIAAYTRGIFPWYSDGDPILWWSPDPRMVLIPDQLHISRSLAKTLRNRPYDIRIDSAFSEVIGACAGPRHNSDGTWIVADIQAAYLQLHALGYAHSIETWVDGVLAGGLYGVAIGRAFFGESMFSRNKDASKIALAHLCALLQDKGFGIIDCQMETQHLASLGARPMPRSEFAARLAVLTSQGDAPAKWSAEAIQNFYRRDVS